MFKCGGSNSPTPKKPSPQKTSKPNGKPPEGKGNLITSGKNFKDHFIRHKGILEKALGTKYPKYKTHGDAFLKDIGKIIDDGTVSFVGKGTLKKDGEVLNIYRGNGMTVATKPNGEFVTLLEMGKGMDLSILFVP
ncbi:hypothetical protein QJQ58_17100 [Paenibacillus dendritiformis]|uniref:hypothetical protein n=1 Tax=Paenibacillus dendritiformis TaxID=130049 RepID=UPI00248B8FAE|nr:hypothetical protein [Paenibacillus dendritiformis]WGU92299.1 hypothetical protein QJQ58_17100 [Paenibacillus dendritiformis]